MFTIFLSDESKSNFQMLFVSVIFLTTRPALQCPKLEGMVKISGIGTWSHMQHVLTLQSLVQVRSHIYTHINLEIPVSGT